MARQRLSCGGRIRLAFDKREEAQFFLDHEAHPNALTGQVPIRYYKCPRCKRWHVTSKPRKASNHG
jgi:hypothetical protein